MSDTSFCRIAAGAIAAEGVARDDDFVAFRDVRPLGPVHLPVIPRRHVASPDEADAQDDGASAVHLHQHVIGEARLGGMA